jgi:putative transposase
VIARCVPFFLANTDHQPLSRQTRQGVQARRAGPRGLGEARLHRGWARRVARLAVNAIDNAAARRGGDVAGCILHSDRGSQFRSRKAQRALVHHDMVGSMGQVGSAGDNAAMESLFSLLQKNVLNRRTWTTRDELRIEIMTWIERTYHRRHRQPRLGRLTPIEYETIMTPTAPAA